MLATRIRETLARHPHWGPMRISEELGTSNRVVTVTASREGIEFMDRRAVEDFTDRLLEKTRADV